MKVFQKLLLRVDETVALLNISRWTVYRWVEEGRLMGTKIGKGSLRVFARSVHSLIRDNRNKVEKGYHMRMVAAVLMMVFISWSAAGQVQAQLNPTSIEPPVVVPAAPVLGGVPDLTGSFVKIKVKEKQDGLKLVVKVEICNVGSAIAVGPFRVSLLLSENDVLDGGDLFPSAFPIDELAPGECHQPVKGAGKFRVRGLEKIHGHTAFIMIDDGGAVTESNEANNNLSTIISDAAVAGDTVVASSVTGNTVLINDSNLNLYAFEGKPPFDQLARFNFQPASPELVPTMGEVHYSPDFSKAIVIIREGFIGPTQGLVSSGIVIVDMQSLLIEETVVLESLKTGNPSRLVHAYDDPDGKHLWLNNDGPRGEGPEVEATDSVFRVNVDPSDSNYLQWTEIVTGAGHHKSAHSFPTQEAPNARLLFATSNISDRSISVVDNDPTSPTFLQVIKTVPPINPPGNREMVGVDLVPHGMDYSEVSGHLYSGATSPLSCAVTVIDTTREGLPVSCIPAGTGPGQIPAAGYIHAAHHGEIVYTVGSKAADEEAGTPGQGWLSAIDARNKNKVIAVVDLGDVGVGSIDEKNGQKAYLPSNNRRGRTNVAVVVDIDPTSHTYHQWLRDVTIGESGSHRNGEVSPAGDYAFYPNTCDDCNTVSVIDTNLDEEVARLQVDGHASNVGIARVLPVSTSGTHDGPADDIEHGRDGEDDHEHDDHADDGEDDHEHDDHADDGEDDHEHDDHAHE